METQEKIRWNKFIAVFVIIVNNREIMCSKQIRRERLSLRTSGLIKFTMIKNNEDVIFFLFFFSPFPLFFGELHRSNSFGTRSNVTVKHRK